MELNIFTNKVRPDIMPTESLFRILMTTYEAFSKTFGKVPVRVWCDSHPDTAGFEEYYGMLIKEFPVVEKTVSLSDGYRRALLSASERHVFMLEHDWEVLDRIRHSLSEIVAEMEELGLVHLRFNKRTNQRKRWDRHLKELTGKRFNVCLTSCVSNNPHIVNVKRYIADFLPKVKNASGSLGIEHAFSRKAVRDCVAIYGGMGNPPTIRHLDGRNGH